MICPRPQFFDGSGSIFLVLADPMLSRKKAKQDFTATSPCEWQQVHAYWDMIVPHNGVE